MKEVRGPVVMKTRKSISERKSNKGERKSNQRSERRESSSNLI